MPHEVRKTVTVLFSDVVGWTGVGEALDPEALRSLQSRYFDEMQDALQRHGGTVEKFIGDAVMAVFGIPAVHEDDALRAVRAAAEMQRRLEALGEELDRAGGARIQVRIGINTGEVVAGDASAGQRFVTGDAVTVAKRLEEAATAGETLIGEATRALVLEAAQLESVGPVELKGKAAPVAAWRLLGVSAEGMGVRRRVDTPLVGRTVELARLQAAFEETVMEQSCRLVTLLGVAGIGKSRLTAELLASAGERATVLTGRCLPYGEGITFWPVVELIRATGGADAVTAALGGEDADAGAALRNLLEPEADTASSDEIFWATRRLLETLAAERPLVVCFEDIHWAEPTFLDLLEYLAGFIRRSPVLLLCLARPELAERRPSWTGSGVVQLEPLSELEAETLLDGLGELDPEARRRIGEAAEGNPFFAEQLATLALEGGASSLPPTIQALLAERLDRLDPGERAVIERASIIGREFSRRAAADLAPAELQAEVGAHLLSLTRKDLIRPDEAAGPREDGFRFRHILIRDAAYEAMPKALRAELHMRFADTLEAGEGRGGLEEIAGYHLEQAYRFQGDLGVADPLLGARAGDRLSTAGRRALARGDARAAVNLLTRTAALIPDDDPGRLELLPELGSALMRAGELARADGVLAEAVERASATGDERIRLRALVEREFVRSWTRPEAGSEGLVRVANEAIAGLEPLGDDIGLAKAWWLLGEAHSVAGRWSERADALERALVHARRGGSGETATLVALLAQALYYGPTPADEALARCESFLAEAAGDRALEAALQSTLAGLHAMRGDFDEARRLYALAVKTYDELGHEFRRASRSLVGGEIELLAGDPAAAERELRHGYETFERMGERGVRSTLAAFLARTLAAQGRYDEAEEYTRFSEETAGSDDLVTQVVWRATQAVVLAHRVELAPAERLAAEAARLGESTDFLDLQAGALLSLAEVLRLAGRTDEAATAAARAVTTFERKGNLVAARRAAELVSAPEAELLPSPARPEYGPGDLEERRQ